MIDHDRIVSGAPARGWVAAAIAAALLLSACVAGTPSAPADSVSMLPSATPSARPTVEPPSPAPSRASATPPSAAPAAGLPVPSGSPPVSVDPELEALLPASIFEIPLIRGSMPGTVFAGGGSDMCIILCSDEVGRFAEALGVEPSDVTVAFAVNERLAPAAFAYRVRGVDTADLIPARLEMGGRRSQSPGFPVELTVDGRSVTIAFYSPMDSEIEVLYASGDVLVVFLSEPPTDGTNDFGGELPEYIQTELEQVFDLLPEAPG